MKVRRLFSACLSIALILFCTSTFSIGVSADDGIIASVVLTHTHSGSSSGGGCYTNTQYGNVDWIKNIPTTYGNHCGSGDKHIYNYRCGYCGRVYSAAGWECMTCHARSTVNCHCYHNTAIGHSLGCSLSEGSQMGTVNVKKTIDSGYFLTPEFVQSSTMASVTSYVWSNGDTGTCSVTGDGTYTCTVTWTDNGAVRTSSVSYVVEDYDKEPPVINSIELPEARTNEDVVLTIKASDNMGIDSYSFDSKGTWQSGNTLTISLNGKVGCAVKDLAGNVSEVYDVEINNIDKEAPEVDNILQEIGKF